MYRPRIIPVLLLKGTGLVKSVRFKKPRYIGDPINAVRIFNDLQADELVFLDTTATKEKRLVSLSLVKNVGEEANMPFSVGGGINSLNDIKMIIEAGAEKVIISTLAIESPSFIRKAVSEFGSSTIVICVDIKKNLWGRTLVWSRAGTTPSIFSPVEFAIKMEEAGAGELIVQSIDKDGTMNGYDYEMIRSVSEKVSIPIVALGGASALSDIAKINQFTVVNGIAAGSIFVYHGPRKGILMNYPTQEEIFHIFSSSEK